jgi:hypothetical protein
MTHLTIHENLTHGRDLLARVHEEMERSQQDVVTYLACQNSRKAMMYYLHGFLMMNGEYMDDCSLEELLEGCRRMDGRFNEIDLGAVDCRCEGYPDENCYCLGLDKVKECLSVARQIEMLVTVDAPAH